MANSSASLTDSQRFDQSRYKYWSEDYVRFSDLDALGHVNNNAIGEYFENSRAIMFKETLPGWPHRQQLFVLAHISIDYRAELHMPASLRIGTRVLGFGKSSMRMCSAIFKGEKGLAYAETVSVLIEHASRKPIEISPELRKVLMKYGD